MSKIIKDIKKNNSEVIRIEISEFEGKNLIHIRIWYKSKEIDQNTGEYILKPSQKGISLDVSKFDDLKEGIEALGNCIADINSGKETL